MKTNQTNFARWWMVVVFAAATAWGEDGLNGEGRWKIFGSLEC